MFHIPMSSPMMTRMLGFLSCACAAVTMNATHRATAHCFSIFGFIGLLVVAYISVFPSVSSCVFIWVDQAGGPCEPHALVINTGRSPRLLARVLLSLLFHLCQH